MHIINETNQIDNVNRVRRILITGANGFTGQHACTYFAANGYYVYAMVRTPIIFDHENIQTVLCDLSNQESLQTIIQTIQPHYILHLAGQNAVQASWTNPIDTLQTNVMCSAYLLDAIRTQSSKSRTIIVGSILQANPAESFTFKNIYSLSKTMQSLLTEVYSNLFELDVIIAKPTNLIGPGRSTGICSILANKVARIEQGTENNTIVVHNLLAKRDFLDVRDAVKGYDILFSKGNPKKVYEISSGTTRSLKEVSHLFKQLATVDFEIKSDIEQHETLIENDPLPMNSLGWTPVISFEQSLSDILQYQRNYVRKGES